MPLPALAQLPPPPVVPERLKAPLDGYDLANAYGQWVWHVEAQKGPAIDALMADPAPVEGLVAQAKPVIEFRKSNDYGHFLTGEIRRHCPEGRVAGRRADGSCRLVLRRVYVAKPASVYGEDDNPVARWTREQFDPQAFVARMRTLGYSPEKARTWPRPLSNNFANQPVPDRVLRDNATIVTLDSVECPAMAETLGALERQIREGRVDPAAIAAGDPGPPPPPHAIRVETVLRMPDADSSEEVRSSGEPIRTLIAPVLDAADACEAKRKRAAP